jgi:uncharacterized protein involved in cysteine biosynthesis
MPMPLANPVSIISAAFGSLRLAKIQRIIAGTVILAFALWLPLVVGAVYAATDITWSDIGWLEWIGDILAFLVAGFLGLFIYPMLIPIIASFSQETVVRHVEEQDYQIFEKGRHISIGESFGQALAFLGKTLLLNVMALPIYLFFPVLNFAVALLLNSYLLGREMFEIVAYRRLDQKTAMALRKKNRGLVLWTGMLVFLMGFVPILNLFIPILAVIAMTHCVVVCENKQAI